jgi:phosphoenolpyruvate-protein kinase (PTS system EI component)
MVFENAQTIHTPITVCGEMASSIKGFLVGLALGFRSFCVYDKQVDCLKSILYNLSKEDLAFIADKMWSFSNSQEISRFFEKFLNKI